MRYFTACGCYPKPIEAQFTLSGPQDESQIPDGVKALFAMNSGIKQVAVFFDHGNGERIETFRRMEEPPCPPT